MSDFNELIAFAFGEEELKAEIDKWLEFVALSVGEDGNVGGQEHRDLLFFLFEFRKALFAPATIDNLGKLMGETYGEENFTRNVEEWIKYITLFTQNNAGSEVYKDLLLFLYQLKVF